MSTKKVYSICGMCTVRCPIMVEVENGEIAFIHGNPYFPAMKGGVCPRGVAGRALIKDNERPKAPLMRVGARGDGQWREVSWDEALDYVSNKMMKIRDTYGPESIALSDRGGPFRDMRRAFLRGFGTPNYCNHDASCARNVHHANLSLTGLGRKDVVYDLKNAKHVVLQFRNIFEAINVQEVNNLMDALENECKLSVIDIRANVSSTKAHHFMMIRPGTDYGFNLAVINEILNRKLYDEAYANRFIEDLDKLQKFVQPYTPKWAEKETGVPAAKLSRFVEDLAKAKPSVIWHPGWMTARYRQSFYICRSIYIINALLGTFGAKGGLPFVNKPSDFGKKGLNKFMDLYPKPEAKRADGAGWKFPQFEEGPGLAHLLFKAMETSEPYPVKGYIAYRHDPLMGFPDPDRLKNIFSSLELLVSVTFTWSDTAWFSDVVLPLSPYLERESIIATKNGLKPYFFLRQRAVDPRFDTRADWEIISGIAKRIGLSQLVFDSVEDVWRFQLEGTGMAIEDFADSGIVQTTDVPRYNKPEEFTFKTPGGKIEIVSKNLESWGIESLQPYQSPQKPDEGEFRLTFGRCALHTQGHTANNPLLFEQMAENILWINTTAAEKLGISDNEIVTVSQNGYSETIKAKVTDMIHPEAVFVIHGFGHRIPVESRAYMKGLADNKFMKNGIDIYDPVGGAVAFQEHFVRVSSRQ